MQQRHEQAALRRFWTHEYAEWADRWKLPLRIEEDEQDEARKAYLAVKWANRAATIDMLFYKQHIRPDPAYGMARYLTTYLSQQDTVQLACFRLPNLPIRVITERASLPRSQRLCLRFQQQALDDKNHLVFECPALGDARTDFQDLLATTTLPALLEKLPRRVAKYITQLLSQITADTTGTYVT